MVAPILALLDIGMGELLVILVIALLLFGGRLPEVARSLGRTIGEFKRSADRITSEFRETMDDRPRWRPPAPSPERKSVPRSASVEPPAAAPATSEPPPEPARTSKDDDANAAAG